MKSGQIMKSTGVVGGFTMISRVLGLVRDMLMAGIFGVSLPMSAFVVAFTIPNLFRRLFGEGALSAAFMPVFVETRTKEGDAKAWELANHVLSLLAVILLSVVLLGVAGITITLFSADLTPKIAMTLALSSVMLPYMLFICLAALCMAILNAHHHFATPAAAPSLLNGVWICTVLVVLPFLGDDPEVQIFGVAWAVFLAGILQLGIQLPRMMQYGYRPAFTFRPGDPRVRRILCLMGPASLGMAITQINVLIDRLLATWIGVWAPAALFFCERLIYLPQGIFATALSTVLLPVFSKQAARADHGDILHTINYSLRNLLYVMIPASIGLLVLARPIVQLIFERAAFDETSTELTAIALMFYAPGLLVFGLSKVFVPAFYAMQDTKTPLKIGMISVGIKLALSLIFIATWPLYYKHAGLALATVLGEGINGVLLAILLHRRLGSPGWRTIGISALRCLIAAAAMGFVAVWMNRWLVTTLTLQGFGETILRLIAVLGAIGCAMVIYVAVTWLLRSPEIHNVARALRRKF